MPFLKERGHPWYWNEAFLVEIFCWIKPKSKSDIWAHSNKKAMLDARLLFWKSEDCADTVLKTNGYHFSTTIPQTLNRKKGAHSSSKYTRRYVFVNRIKDGNQNYLHLPMHCRLRIICIYIYLYLKWISCTLCNIQPFL